MSEERTSIGFGLGLIAGVVGGMDGGQYGCGGFALEFLYALFVASVEDERCIEGCSFEPYNMHAATDGACLEGTLVIE